jgi:hypothetical protein
MITMTSNHYPWRKRAERELTFEAAPAPGIDLAVLIAVGSALVDILTLLQPWLLGVNDEYVTGKGLTYAVEAEVSGFQLLQIQPYLAILLVPAFLAGVSIILAILPDNVFARVSYKVKSGLLLVICIALSLYPPSTFMNNLANGANMAEGLHLIASFWVVGSGATLPVYAAIGFAGALALRIFKD